MSVNHLECAIETAPAPCWDMVYPYRQFHSDGTFWNAGRSIWNLCAAWNFATNPGRMMTDSEHRRARTYSKAIRNRMARLGYKYGEHYKELSNGLLWPLREHDWVR